MEENIISLLDSVFQKQLKSATRFQEKSYFTVRLFINNDIDHNLRNSCHQLLSFSSIHIVHDSKTIHQNYINEDLSKCINWRIFNSINHAEACIDQQQLLRYLDEVNKFPSEINRASNLDVSQSLFKPCFQADSLFQQEVYCTVENQ